MTVPPKNFPYFFRGIATEHPQEQKFESLTPFLSNLLIAHLVGKDVVWTKGIWKDSSSEQPDLNIEHSET